MATITTVNTAQMVQSLAYQFTQVSQSLASLGGSVNYNASYVLDSRTGEESNYGGTWKFMVKHGSTSLSRNDTYNKFPFDGPNGPLTTGKQSISFTGKDLTSNSMANATGFKFSYAGNENTNNTKNTYKDAVTAKIAFNPITGGDLAISQASASSNYSRTYTGGNYGTEKTTHNEAFKFTGAADLVNGQLEQFNLKSYSASNTQGHQQGSNSATFTDKFAITSKAGLNYDADTYYSGSIDSVSYSANISGKESGTSFKIGDNFKSTAWSQDNISALNTYLSADNNVDRASALDDLVESLLAGNDTIKAGSVFSNDLYGGAGNDTLTGGAGDDRLIGGTGNDKLNGGKGSDLIIGSAGTDTLTGGAGHDLFIFYANDSTLQQASMDVITDFKIKDNDKLVFDFQNPVNLNDDTVVFALEKSDKQASFDALLAAAQSAASEGALVYVGITAKDSKHGYAFVDLDGDGSMDMGIKLAGVTSSNKIGLTGISDDLGRVDSFQSISLSV
jgi:Ca2+-binding RTX toxin-like protein